MRDQPKGIIMKKFPDGSELKAGHLAAACVGASIFGVAVFAVKEKISDKLTKRWMKKHDYPQEVIDRY